MFVFSVLEMLFQPSMLGLYVCFQCPRVAVMFALSCTFVFSVPELLFQPSMLGVEQAGLAEALDYVLKKFDLPSQNRMCQVHC